MNEDTKNLLDKPLDEWADELENDSFDRQGLEEELSNLIQRATLLYDYVSFRFNTGCGDQGHPSGAKHANKALTRVRKALGYSYPHSHVEIR